MTKKHKAMSNRLQKLSHDMVAIAHELEGFSPENAAQLEGAGLMVSEWAEDILIGANSP